MKVFWITLIVLLLVIIIVATIIFYITSWVCRRPQIQYFDYNANTQTPRRIDVVYTWLNATDPRWIREKQKYASENNPDVLDAARFNNSSNDPDIELRTSIATVLKYCPWVRTIHIITMRPQIPPSLEPGGGLYEFYALGRIRVAFHDQIFRRSKKYLPVFNSQAIECHLDRVPGLAKHFIYFNDDFYVGRPMQPSYFFQKNRSIQRGTWVTSDIGMLPSHNFQCIARNAKLLGTKFYFMSSHVAIPLTKHMMRKARAHFKSEFEQTGRARFRDGSQVVPHWIAVNLALDQKKAIGYTAHTDPVVTYVVNYSITPIIVDKWLQTSHLFCINDIPAIKMKEIVSRIRKIHCDDNLTS